MDARKVNRQESDLLRYLELMLILLFNQASVSQLNGHITKCAKNEIAELSRPNRAASKAAHKKQKNTQGRKKKNESGDATYTNWHMPFLWSQIVEAAKHPSVGFKMSVKRIVKVLQMRNPADFSLLSSSTVQGWIDQSGSKPRWSDAALRMAENGNFQGHNKGGQRGVLVRS